MVSFAVAKRVEGVFKVPKSAVHAAVRVTIVLCAVACGIAVSGCAYVPPPKPLIDQPMTARPPRPVPPAVPNGAIYQVGYGDRPLFQDPRPRNIGDIITIVINENINATKSSGANASRTSSADFKPSTSGFFSGFLNHTGIGLAGDNSFKAAGGANAQNTFTGTITVTVTDVLPNGNLAVSGEKQMLINQGNEYIRFSGVVDPTSISGSNTVSSTQVADAKIEYSAKGYINEAETMGWLQRFFQSISPF